MNNTTTCTLAEARRILGVSEKTMRNYCKANKIPFHKERNVRGVHEYRFKLEDLEEYLHKKQGIPGHTTTYHTEIDEINSDNKMSTRIIRDDKNHSTTNKDGNISRKKSLHTECHYQETFIKHLLKENAFLKEQLMEKDKQLAAKDRHTERQLDRLSNLNDTLSTLTLQLFKKA